MHDFKRILFNLAEVADQPLLRGFGSDLSLSRKNGGELVTNIDQETNAAAMEFLEKSGFPVVFSEEGRKETTSPDEYWLLDPLDGTREYAKGIPEFAFSAAWIVNGIVEAAVVSNPVLGFRALGTLQDGVTSVVTAPFLHSRSATLVSRSELSRDLFSGFPAHISLQPMGSVALKLALVATGHGHSTVSVQPKHAWDIAGGIGLVKMAGGQACDLAGDEFLFLDGFKLHETGVFALLESQDKTQLRHLAQKRMQEIRGGR